LLDVAGIHWIGEDEARAFAYDLVIEASGRPAGFELACRAVRPEGSIVLKSTYAGHAETDLSRLVVNEVTLIGSRCGELRPALNLLARGAVNPGPLIDARYPLSRAVAAFEHAARPGALKILVECARP
jgi:threonine dehydrogenase-like Zn-dependent dehydrogenase